MTDRARVDSGIAVACVYKPTLAVSALPSHTGGIERAGHPSLTWSAVQGRGKKKGTPL